jgi:hypothetical protein
VGGWGWGGCFAGGGVGVAGRLWLGVDLINDAGYTLIIFYIFKTKSVRLFSNANMIISIED